MSQIEFETALLQLPAKSRAELAQKLLSSLDMPSQIELDDSLGIVRK
jgi:hypothetical protein